jgi:predicted AAA+ superfamily ATPase
VAGSTDGLESLLQRLDRIAEALEGTAAQVFAVNWDECIAFRWCGERCEPVRHRHIIGLDDLHGIDARSACSPATRPGSSLGDRPTMCLLTGARRTGKSSLVKAVLEAHASEGLRLIEVDREELGELRSVVDRVAGSPRRFIVSAMTSPSTPTNPDTAHSRRCSTAPSRQPGSIC